MEENKTISFSIELADDDAKALFAMAEGEGLEFEDYVLKHIIEGSLMTQFNEKTLQYDENILEHRVIKAVAVGLYEAGLITE